MNHRKPINDSTLTVLPGAIRGLKITIWAKNTFNLYLSAALRPTARTQEHKGFKTKVSWSTTLLHNRFRISFEPPSLEPQTPEVQRRQPGPDDGRATGSDPFHFFHSLFIHSSVIHSLIGK